MEELKHNEVVKDYSEVIEAMRKLDPNLNTVKIEVKEDFRRSLVEVRFAGQSIVFTVAQARDLAFEIRQAANRVEKQALAQGIKLGRRKRR